MKLTTTIKTLIFSGEHRLLRRLYTTTAPPRNPTRIVNKFELYRKLSGVGASGQKITDALHNLTQDGSLINNGDLVFCFRKLRKHRRYPHCLEILEWLEKSSSDHSNYALRLDLLCKLKGIDEAEAYFLNLPPEAKKPYVYGAMLNCYCSKNMVVKALALFREIEEKNWVANSLIFNNIMGLYMKLDQPEKVPLLVDEMKQRNIPLIGIVYHIWIQSYGRLNDLEGVERVAKEVESNESLKNDWKIYSCFATAYINLGQSEKSASALKKLEDILDHSTVFDRDGYHHLISLYSRNGDIDAIFQAWAKLTSKSMDCHNRSYLIMLQALSKLKNIEGMKKLLEEWEYKCRSYDVKLPGVVIEAYLRNGMVDDAELLLNNTINRNTGQKLWYAHLSFMDYYLGKGQIDFALKHLEEAYSNGWKPIVEKLGPFFKYFVQEKDFLGAEELCNMLKGVKSIDSTAYLCLLQTYVAAGKELTGLRQRMEEDGVDITSEHEEIFSNVCQN